MRARLSPSDPVLLLHSDGTETVWRANAPVPGVPAAKVGKFVAVELPDDLLLRRGFELPAMSQADTDQAVLLEVQGNSPFAPEDLAWGHVIRDLRDGQRRAEIAIASRRHIGQFIQSRWPDLAGVDKTPEVWVVAGLPAPIVIAGYGEHKRLSHAASKQRWDVALLVAALILASLAAMSPTVQLRFRALEAAEAFESLVTRVTPLVRKRDEISAMNDKLRALDAAVGDRVDPAGVIAYLTEILPDDTHLYSLDIQKSKIIAAGHTVDASALLQKLSADPKLRDVRSPTAVTRVPGAAKEAFTVEFTMEKKQTAAAAPVPGPGALPVATAPMVAVPAQGPVPMVAPVVQAAPPPFFPASAAGGAARPAPPAAAVSSPFTIGGAKR
ncbi:MAG: PilN domain-containing protein [Ramlibacter sp.]